jgi:uncharacterized membrane protein
MIRSYLTDCELTGMAGDNFSNLLYSISGFWGRFSIGRWGLGLGLGVISIFCVFISLLERDYNLEHSMLRK